ncbi:hypothetical protein [Kitasatospora sp. NPDC057223]|uniref:hypothetical protein n=1 Tax=Kitasatospora sp. NPDC057223 TaxID=3346055 RepID=UPI003639700A
MADEKQETEIPGEVLTPDLGDAHFGLLCTCAMAAFLFFVFGSVAAIWSVAVFAFAFVLISVFNLVFGQGFVQSVRCGYLGAFGIWQWFSGW